MSIDVSATAYCDGKGCGATMHDADDMFCSSCANAEHGEPAPSIRDWVDANGMSLSCAEQAFMDRVVESFESGLPLALVRSAVAA